LLLELGWGVEYVFSQKRRRGAWRGGGGWVIKMAGICGHWRGEGEKGLWRGHLWFWPEVCWERVGLTMGVDGWAGVGRCAIR